MAAIANADTDLERLYLKAEKRYQRSLPPEHYMEPTSQAKQREITVGSFALIHDSRPDFQYFNELLVQYPKGKTGRIAGVVPDNMVVVCREPIRAVGSFNIPLQPVGPFLMLEYVSQGSKRKDYVDNRRRYEKDLHVPYYLLFHPEEQELILYRMALKKYGVVAANAKGRLEIPELELEVALHERWVRYWFRGEFLDLPSTLRRGRETEKIGRLAEKAGREAEKAGREAEKAGREAERIARLETERKLADSEMEIALLRERLAKWEEKKD